MRLRSQLSIAAILAVTLTSGAFAQNWSVDTKGVDAGAPAQPRAKKGKQADVGGKPEKGGKAENRQFGELEGWSPGKSPPGKKKEEDKDSRFGGKAPVSMTPSGGMSVGMPF